MPAVNIRMNLFKRALENKVDIAAVVNEYLESYLDEIENTEG